MKKLLTTIAIVAVATITHAASVSWSATSVKDINGASAKNIAEEAGWTVVCTIYAADGSTVVGSSTDKTSNAMSKFSGTIDGTSNNTDYFAQLVMTDGAGNTITSEKAAFTTDTSAVYGEINFSNGSMFATSGAKINYTSGWVAAPEPTSGLLLLMGLAGLALKRKHA